MLVSIIIPCFNQANFLNETLESVFNQSYTNWECLIIDDESTDNSYEIVAEWVKRDNRFNYILKKNSGVSDTRNIGLENAKGNLIQFLDADDFLYKDKIQLSVNAIEDKNADIVCTNYKMCTDIKGKLENPFSQLDNYEFNLNNILIYWNDGFTIPIHCFLFKSNLFKDLRFPFGLTAQEDWSMWVQVYKKNPITHFINQTLVLYRINPHGRTNTSGFFDETLVAIDFLKPKLTELEFKMLYEATIKRYYSSFIYWRGRERNLKASNTYRFGLFFKKVFLKLGLIKVVRKVFNFICK